MKNNEIKAEIFNKNDKHTLFEVMSDYKSILKIDNDGDIYVKGKLIENDKEVVEAFREYFKIGNLNNIVRKSK